MDVLVSLLPSVFMELETKLTHSSDLVAVFAKEECISFVVCLPGSNEMTLVEAIRKPCNYQADD